jgi:hypothetical protein
MPDIPKVSGAERAVLTGPDSLAKMAAAGLRDPRQKWMLRQPRDVRRAFAKEVLDAEDGAIAVERWMLLQADEIRESYILHVLKEGTRGDRREWWMLRQNRKVRESFVREVIDAADPDEEDA